MTLSAIIEAESVKAWYATKWRKLSPGLQTTLAQRGYTHRALPNNPDYRMWARVVAGNILVRVVLSLKLSGGEPLTIEALDHGKRRYYQTFELTDDINLALTQAEESLRK